MKKHYPIQHQESRQYLGAQQAQTWAAVAGAAVAAVGTAVNSNQQRKAAGKTAPYQTVDLGEEQAKSLEANLGNEGSIEALLNRGNAFNVNQALLTENALNPGMAGLRGDIQDTASDLLKNPYDLPDDVAKNLERLGAERGITTGIKGQASDYSLLRDFGINSLQYGQSRINQAGQLTGLLSSVTPKVNPMSPLSFYVAPEQALGNATRNNENQQAIAQGGINARNAATAQGNADMWNSFSTLVGAGVNAWNKSGSSTGGGGTTPGSYNPGNDAGPDY